LLEIDALTVRLDENCLPTLAELSFLIANWFRDLRFVDGAPCSLAHRSMRSFVCNMFRFAYSVAMSELDEIAQLKAQVDN
jgi:hypothetical protein